MDIQLVVTVMNVTKWQARGSNVDIQVSFLPLPPHLFHLVTLSPLNNIITVLQVEPLPSNLPAEILADEKWLKNDLMCIMANAAKVCHY